MFQIPIVMGLLILVWEVINNLLELNHFAFKARMRNILAVIFVAFCCDCNLVAKSAETIDAYRRSGFNFTLFVSCHGSRKKNMK